MRSYSNILALLSPPGGDFFELLTDNFTRHLYFHMQSLKFFCAAIYCVIFVNYDLL